MTELERVPMTASPKMPELLPCPVCQQWQKRFAGLLCDYGVGLYPARTPPPAPSTPASILADIETVLGGMGESAMNKLVAATRLARHIQGKEGV